MIFTAVEHPGILALLATDARIAIVAKEEPLHCLRDAIAAAGSSPAIVPRIFVPGWPIRLSHYLTVNGEFWP